MLVKGFSIFFASSYFLGAGPESDAKGISASMLATETLSSLSPASVSVHTNVPTIHTNVTRRTITKSISIVIGQEALFKKMEALYREASFHYVC